MKAENQKTALEVENNKQIQSELEKQIEKMEQINTELRRKIDELERQLERNKKDEEK